jgi:clan AA aspartic protease
MKPIYTTITLSNPIMTDLEPMDVKALADTGAVHLVIPEHLAIQLQLKELEKREVTLADGSKKTVSYVGPIKVKFKNRSCFAGALVMGQTPLLGAIAMEDLDLVLLPFLQKVDVNPQSPNVPQSLAM